MKTLILYFTTDGQTQRIAQAIAAEIEHEVELVSLKQQAVDFAENLQVPIKL
ncbi:flavodoxin [Actinobacillus equuli]|nr:flavodoxin [Actinobacillus equuli]